jgi:hypothetical protein
MKHEKKGSIQPQRDRQTDRERETREEEETQRRERRHRTHTASAPQFPGVSTPAEHLLGTRLVGRGITRSTAVYHTHTSTKEAEEEMKKKKHTHTHNNSKTKNTRKHPTLITYPPEHEAQF